MLKPKAKPRVLALLALSSCGLLEPEGCDLCTTSAVVYGTITDSLGQPVSGVQVDIRVHLDQCSEEQWRGGTDNGWPITDDRGAYRARPISLFGAFEARCLIVTPNPRNDARWPMGADTVSVSLQFLSDYRSSRRDSVRVDLMVGPDG